MGNFSDLLLQWYQEHQRVLPWRNQSDPYKIWISEIVLQQTRVEQGKEYYLRFIQRFPNVQALAEAEEDEVLKYWQGLGYYTRARNLHLGAKYIMDVHKGIFPCDYESILKIKGVGSYTAAAIASMAFNLPYAAIDGNAYRVLSRVFDVAIPIDSHKGKLFFAELAKNVLNTKQAGAFNQAIMDFGALQCKPTRMQCEYCCLMDICLAYKNKTQHILPIKEKSIKIKKRYFYYLYIIHNNTTYIQKRLAKDIWMGLYEFPLIESATELGWEQIMANTYFTKALQNCSFILEKISPIYKHKLTHQHIISQFFFIRVQHGTPQWHNNMLNIEINTLHNYPMSRLITHAVCF